MLRGCRSFLVALVGLALISAQRAPSEAPRERQPAVEQRSDPQTQKAAQTIAAAIRDAIHARAEDEGCEDRPDNRRSDLCAQWKAADAAHDAADYTLWSLLVGIVGTGLLIWTLWETRLTGIREQRAYVRVEPGADGVVLPDEPVCIPLQIVNYGKTPARKLAIESAVVVRPPDWSWSSESARSNPAKNRPEITIHPDTPFLTTAVMDKLLPRDVYNAIMAGQAAVFIKGRVIYRDVFKRHRETTFQLEFHAADKGSGRDGKLRISPTGNDFT